MEDWTADNSTEAEYTCSTFLLRKLRSGATEMIYPLQDIVTGRKLMTRWQEISTGQECCSVHCSEWKSARPTPKVIRLERRTIKPLPVPDRSWQHLSQDFIQNLPESGDYDANLVKVDDWIRMRYYLHFGGTVDSEYTTRFYDKYVRMLYGLAQSIMSDREIQCVFQIMKCLKGRQEFESFLCTAHHLRPMAKSKGWVPTCNNTWGRTSCISRKIGISCFHLRSLLPTSKHLEAPLLPHSTQNIGFIPECGSTLLYPNQNHLDKGMRSRLLKIKKDNLGHVFSIMIFSSVAFWGPNQPSRVVRTKFPFWSVRLVGYLKNQDQPPAKEAQLNKPGMLPYFQGHYPLRLPAWSSRIYVDLSYFPCWRPASCWYGTTAQTMGASIASYWSGRQEKVGGRGHPRFQTKYARPRCPAPEVSCLMGWASRTDLRACQLLGEWEAAYCKLSLTPLTSPDHGLDGALFWEKGVLPQTWSDILWCTWPDTW